MMKKRLKKVLALGMAAAMLAGAPLPAMAAEAAPADAAVTAETQPEIAMQAADEDAAGTALPNGVDPLTLDGLVQLNDGNWYYMQNCRVSGAANKTVKPACGSWWYVGGCRVDFSYTGFGRNGADNWYVQNGQVQFGYTGIVTAKDETNRTYVCYVTNGRLDTDYTGLAYGTVDGVEGWYNFHDGYNFHEGYLNKGKELVEYNGAWWYVSDERKVDFSYTGIAYNEAGGWYVRNGQVDFSYSGCVAADGNTRYLRRYYLVENGRLRKEVSGLVQATVEGVNGWWKIDQGVITVQSGGSETFLVYYNGDWWYVLNSGQVDFSFTGLKGYNGETWYVENGRVNFDKTGFVNLSGDTTTRYTYIQNGHPLPYGFSGLFYAELDGKTTWWQIEEGHCDYYGGPEPSHYERPESFAANEEGLWATNNSQISYGITGVYKTIGRIGYSSSYSIEVEYTYNVVNGLVTEMQAVIL